MTITCLTFLALAACAPATPIPGAATATPAAAPGSKPAGGEAAKPAKLDKIRIAESSGDFAFHLPYWVADTKGFWEKEGIAAPDMIKFSSTSERAQGLIANAVEFATTTPEVVITPIQKGANIIIISSDTDSMPFSLLVRPEIKSWDDLRGKRVGVAAVKSGSTPSLVKMMAQHGLKEADYELITAGGTQERFAALKNGAIAAGLLNQPEDLMAVGEGFRILGMITDITPVSMYSTVAVRTDWAKLNKDLIVRYIRALNRAGEWVLDPSNKEEAIKIMAAKTKTSDTIARQTYDIDLKIGTWKKTPEPSVSALKIAMDDLIQVGVLTGSLLPPEKYIDRSYWEESVKK